MALKPKVAAFVQEYLLDLNAKQAAIRCGYSPRSAEVQGYRLLCTPEVKEAVQKAMDKRSRRTEITQDMVLNEIALLAFGNIKRVFGPDGQLIPVEQLPDDVAATITEVTSRMVTSEGENVVIDRKYKLADKKASLELLGRHLKLFTDKIEVDVTDRAAELIAARKRIESAV
jgi:phage terminase small subunit